MTRCRCHARNRCRCHGDGWKWLGIVITFPLWLAFWVGKKIHARWGKTGAWIYVGAWVIAGALSPVVDDPNVPPPPAPVVVTVTTTVTP